MSEDQSIKARELFVQALRNVGYEPGTNVDIEYRYAAADAERLRAMANELVHLSVDVVGVFGIAAASAAKKATTTIPIVMAVAADPGRVGLVQNLAKPGGNVTGVVTVSEALAGKRLQLLKEAVPNLVRVAVLLNPSFPVNAPLLENSQTAARELGLRLEPIEVREPRDFRSAFAAVIKKRADALVVLPDPLTSSHQPEVVEFATRNRLPAIFTRRWGAEAGALMSYGANLHENFRRAAVYVDRILKGAKPADLPVEQATEFEFLINLKKSAA